MFHSKERFCEFGSNSLVIASYVCRMFYAYNNLCIAIALNIASFKKYFIMIKIFTK